VTPDVPANCRTSYRPTALHFTIMKRRRKYRPRLEFLHLEAQLERDFEAKAWRQFIDEVVHGKEPGTKSYLSQFRLRDRILRLHERRNRWNAKRRLKKRDALAKQMRPEYLAYAAAGHLKLGEAGCDDFDDDLLAGALCLDARLTKKFLDRLETIHERFYPAVPPWQIDGRRAAIEAEAPPLVCEERRAFEETLKPTPVPAEPPNAIPFDIDHAQETEKSVPARAAS